MPAAGEPPPFRDEHFARQDEGADAGFYADERLVQHLDEAGRAALTDFYRAALPAGGRILDLMSSWVSHLPDEVAYAHVAGLGMNRAELDANPRLDGRVVHDLNLDPALPWPEAAFDACLVALSVQYLTRPLEVFAAIARVLAPGGPCIVSFSNRCFPTKAVALWRALGDSERGWLVGEYFRRAGGFADAEAHVIARGGTGADPLYAVVARRELR